MTCFDEAALGRGLGDYQVHTTGCSYDDLDFERLPRSQSRLRTGDWDANSDGFPRLNVTV